MTPTVGASDGGGRGRGAMMRRLLATFVVILLQLLGGAALLDILSIGVSIEESRRGNSFNSRRALNSDVDDELDKILDGLAPTAEEHWHFYLTQRVTVKDATYTTQVDWDTDTEQGWGQRVHAFIDSKSTRTSARLAYQACTRVMKPANRRTSAARTLGPGNRRLNATNTSGPTPSSAASASTSTPSPASFTLGPSPVSTPACTCLNGGNATGYPANSTHNSTCACACTSVWEGDTCANAKKCQWAADGNRCRNGGTVIGTLAEGENSMRNCGCDCADGYMGEHCWEKKPCNGAESTDEENTCVNGVPFGTIPDDDCICECEVGFEGNTCADEQTFECTIEYHIVWSTASDLKARYAQMKKVHTNFTDKNVDLISQHVGGDLKKSAAPGCVCPLKEQCPCPEWKDAIKDQKLNTMTVTLDLHHTAAIPEEQDENTIVDADFINAHKADLEKQLSKLLMFTADDVVVKLTADKRGSSKRRRAGATNEYTPAMAASTDTVAINMMHMQDDVLGIDVGFSPKTIKGLNREELETGQSASRRRLNNTPSASPPSPAANMSTPAPAANVPTPAPAANVSTPAPAANVSTTSPAANLSTPMPAPAPVPQAPPQPTGETTTPANPSPAKTTTAKTTPSSVTEVTRITIEYTFRRIAHLTHPLRMAMDPRIDTRTSLREQFRLLVVEKAMEEDVPSFNAANLSAPRLSFADETVEIRYMKEFLDEIIVPPFVPSNSCPYESEDLIVIVWMETLCFIFENPITTTIVSASTLFILILCIGGCMGSSYKSTGRLCCPICRCCTQMGLKCCGCLKCCRCCRCCRCCIVELVEENDDEVFVPPTRWCDCSCCCEKREPTSTMPSGSNSGSLGILVRGRSKSAKEFKVVPVGGRTVHAPVEIVYAMHDFEDMIATMEDKSLERSKSVALERSKSAGSNDGLDKSSKSREALHTRKRSKSSASDLMKMSHANHKSFRNKNRSRASFDEDDDYSSD